MRLHKNICVLTVLTMLLLTFFPCTSYAQFQIEETKITPILSSHLQQLSDADDITVYLFTEEVPEKEVLDTMRTSKPEYYEVYCQAKNSDLLPENIVINPDMSLKDGNNPLQVNYSNSDLLQEAIEYKRSLYAAAYNQKHKELLSRTQLSDEHVLFSSSYSPMQIIKTNKEKIIELSESKLVTRVDIFVDAIAVDEISVANEVTRAAYVRDTYENDGSGVKIGQIETAFPDITHYDLTSDNITLNTSIAFTTSPHATKMARIMVGQDHGLAPAAQLYCSYYNNLTSFYTQVEWLISQGVNIINMSAGMYSANVVEDGTYDSPSVWVDHIAPLHDVHFVKSAGNSTDDNVVTRYITSPGMAYNAITVGGFDDNDTISHSDDTEYSTSDGSTAYNEKDSSGRPEKPNLVAPAQDILYGTIGSGTSSACAQVTGVIAQLCSYNSALKTKQTAIGAILAASSARKVSVGNGEQGYSFPTSERISGSAQISEKQGAGKLDSQWARGIVYYGNYWSTTIDEEDFPYTKYVTINASSNSLTRIAIFWLKRNTLTADHGSTVNVMFSDLDLRVYDPSNNEIAYSITAYSNFEIVQFVPSVTGSYKIVIEKAENNSTEKDHVGIAVW